MSVEAASTGNYSFKHKIFSPLCIFIIISNLSTTLLMSLDELIYTYELTEPFQISKKTQHFKDLENIVNCECPRVYWPACSEENVTFVNACVLNCLKQKLRRLGPCLAYRRNGSRKMVLYVPSKWKVANKTSL